MNVENKWLWGFRIAVATAVSAGLVAMAAGAFTGDDVLGAAQTAFVRSAPAFFAVYFAMYLWLLRRIRKDMTEVWIQAAKSPEERSARWTLWHNGGWKAVKPHIVGTSLFKSYGAKDPDEFYDTLLAPSELRPRKSPSGKSSSSKSSSGSGKRSPR